MLNEYFFKEFSCKRKPHAYVAPMSDENVGESANTTVSESTDFNLSIRVPIELINLADQAGKSLGLKRADVIRLSLGRGIDRLLEQLDTKIEEVKL
jgi:hypothetical protein